MCPLLHFVKEKSEKMSEYVVELKNATKRFPGVVALKNMQLSVKPGEILGLIGENGAGKSTLIKVLTGVHQADEGQIFVDGVEQHFKDPNDSAAAGIACVYQELNIEKLLSITDNIFINKWIKKGTLLDYPTMHKKAKEVMADGDAMEEDVQSASEALLNAILAQRFKANKSILEELVNKAEGMDVSGYTAESVAVFKAALYNANLVLADETLSEEDQAVVDEAVAELNEAIENLSADTDEPSTDDGKDDTDTSKPDDTTSGNEDSSNNSSNNGSANESSTSTQTPTTGDNTPVMMLVLLVVVAGLALVVIVRRKARIAE